MSDLRNIFLSRDLRLTLGVERNIWLPALVFVTALSIFESIVFGTGWPQLLSDLYDADDTVYLVIGVFYVAAALYLSFLFILATLSSRWPHRIVYLLLFSFVTFAQYGYCRALGRFTNYYDLVAAFTATPQQTADSIAAYVNWTALLPCLVLLALCIAIRYPAKPFKLTGLLVVFAVLSVFYVHLYYINQAIFDRRFVSNSFGSSWQTTVDFVMLDPLAAMRRQRRETVDVPDVGGNYKPTNNVIFIFDESVRADHLSVLGYSRPTTPYLEKLNNDGVMKNWGIAVSASTISHPSYNAMVVGATPDMLDERSFGEINTMPTLFQYAKAMKYRTFLIDGQMKGYWGGIADDLHYIDELVTLNEIDSPERVEDWEKGDKITNEDNKNNTLKQWEIDPKIASLANQIFSTSTGNFVFIYKRGCHFPYEKNYPEAESVWKPIYRFREQYEIPPADQKQAIVNSYDNALRYNLDDFFTRLSPDYSNLPNNTVIVYTSDHGESFFANGKAGHGGDTPEEAMVPLLIFGLNDRVVDTKFKATHANVFTTLLDLMSYPPEMRKYPYQISLFEGRSDVPARRFFNPPAGKKVAFD